MTSQRSLHQELPAPALHTDPDPALCVQVTRLALMNSKLSQSLSLHNLATNLDSDEDNSAASTPQPASPSQSSLVINLKKKR